MFYFLDIFLISNFSSLASYHQCPRGISEGLGVSTMFDVSERYEGRIGLDGPELAYTDNFLGGPAMSGRTLTWTDQQWRRRTKSWADQR